MDEVLDLREFLDVLPSPAFVLDLKPFANLADVPPDAIKFAVVNKIAQEPHISSSLERDIQNNSSFRQWLCLHQFRQDAYEGDDFQFFSSLVRGISPTLFRNRFNGVDRYKVIQTRQRLKPPSRRLQVAPRLLASWTEAWSRHAPQRNVELHRQHLQYLLAKDWSKTPMGPLESWPQSLRTISSYVMNCPFPCALYWGEDLCIF